MLNQKGHCYYSFCKRQRGRVQEVKAMVQKSYQRDTLLFLLQRLAKLSGPSFRQNTRVQGWRLTFLLGKHTWTCHHLARYVYLLMKSDLYYLSEQFYCAIMDDKWTLSKPQFWIMAFDRKHGASNLLTLKHWIWNKKVWSCAKIVLFCSVTILQLSCSNKSSGAASPAPWPPG